MRTRGVALIIAVVAVAIIAALATQVSTFTLLDESRVATLLSADAAAQISLGAEGLAAETLKQIVLNSPNQINFSQGWAIPQTLPYTDGVIAVRIEDLQGRINLNNVVNSNGSPNEVVIAQLKRLFVINQVDPRVVDKLVDWIDSDNLPYGSDGAEDDVYLRLDSPLRPANHPITSVSALRYLPGMDAQQFERIKPFVSALPPGTKLNVCTARAAVLASLADGFTTFSQDEQALNVQRRTGCFPQLKDLAPQLASAVGNAALSAQIQNNLAESSNYFRIQSTITRGTFTLRTYSVLNVGADGAVVVLRRSVGWD